MELAIEYRFYGKIGENKTKDITIISSEEKEILVKVSQLRTVVHNGSVEKAIALIKDITILFSQRKDF